VDELAGKVKVVTFRDFITHKTRFILENPDGFEFVCVGSFPNIKEGAEVILRGEFPEWGNRNVFLFKEYEIVNENLDVGLKYLLSLVPGVGKIRTKTILNQVAPDELIKNPTLIRDVAGIPESVKEAVEDFLNNYKEIERIVRITHDAVTFKDLLKIAKILRQTGKPLNPWRLPLMIEHVDVHKLDQHLAKIKQIDPHNPDRIAAYIHAMYNRMISNRSNYEVSKRYFVRKVAQSIPVQEFIVRDTLDKHLNELYFQNTFSDTIMRAEFAIYEDKILHKIKNILRHDYEIEDVTKVKKELEIFEGQVGVDFDKSQKAAILGAFTNHISLITGGPGSGKTTVLLALHYIAEKLGKKVAIVTPTGKSAARINESSIDESNKLYAQTIHYRIGWDGLQAHAPIDADLVIIDESSMITIRILSELLSMTPAHARIIFIGDADQLPPVGAGTPFSDLIKSGKFATYFLEGQHRFKQGRDIADFAQMIRNKNFKGIYSVLERKAVNIIRVENALKTATNIYLRAIKKRVGDNIKALHFGKTSKHILSKYLILSATRRVGKTKTTDINIQIAKTIYGAQEYFAPGEKLIVTQNDYELGVFNGEMFYMGGLDTQRGEFKLYPEKHDRELHAALYDLQLFERAYAITVHKAQGSEADVVIIPIAAQDTMRWDWKMLYTAVTRAKKRVILLVETRKTPEKVLYQIANQGRKRQYSRFLQKLKNL